MSNWHNEVMADMGWLNGVSYCEGCLCIVKDEDGFECLCLVNSEVEVDGCR